MKSQNKTKSRARERKKERKKEKKKEKKEKKKRFPLPTDCGKGNNPCSTKRKLQREARWTKKFARTITDTATTLCWSLSCLPVHSEDLNWSVEIFRVLLHLARESETQRDWQLKMHSYRTTRVVSLATVHRMITSTHLFSCVCVPHLVS